MVLKEENAKSSNQAMSKYLLSTISVASFLLCYFEFTFPFDFVFLMLDIIMSNNNENGHDKVQPKCVE